MHSGEPWLLDSSESGNLDICNIIGYVAQLAEPTRGVSGKSVPWLIPSAMREQLSVQLASMTPIKTAKLLHLASADKAGPSYSDNVRKRQREAAAGNSLSSAYCAHTPLQKKMMSPHLAPGHHCCGTANLAGGCFQATTEALVDIASAGKEDLATASQLTSREA
eukprot:2276298-Pleurochrysis_carterae.AAC.1